MNTLLLNLDNWDLCLDAFGNIAMASDPYAPAQDSATYIRTFAGECWYDTTDGIPYFDTTLGQAPPVAFMQGQFEQMALTVPGVESATCSITGLSERGLTGTVLLTIGDQQLTLSFAGDSGSLGTAIGIG